MVAEGTAATPTRLEGVERRDAFPVAASPTFNFRITQPPTLATTFAAIRPSLTRIFFLFCEPINVFAQHAPHSLGERKWILPAVLGSLDLGTGRFSPLARGSGSTVAGVSA